MECGIFRTPTWGGWGWGVYISTVMGVRLALHQCCERQLSGSWKGWHFVIRPPLLASMEILARLLPYFLTVHSEYMAPRWTWIELTEVLEASIALEMWCIETTGEWYTFWNSSNHQQSWTSDTKSKMLSTVPRDSMAVGGAVAHSDCLVSSWGGARQEDSHRGQPLPLIWQDGSARLTAFLPWL